MGGLDHAITALDVLGSVVQAVPVVGDSLKSATEIVTKICETIKKMKENREAYGQLAERAARLLAAVASAISKDNHDQENLKGMEGNVARLLLTLQEIKSAVEIRLHSSPGPSGKLSSVKKFIRIKGKDALRVSADPDEVKTLGAKLDRAVEEFGVASSIGLELVVGDVRALSIRLSQRIEEMNQEMARTAMNATLSTLNPVISALWDEVNNQACMEDTRVQLLADIISWAGASDAAIVFWLNGLAGTGKSTIARTVCEYFAKKSMLGASFFISRQVEKRHQAPHVVRTLAYQLGRQHPAVADALIATLRDSPDLVSSENLTKLISELLIKPASVLATDAGVLIVIDAMDECTDDDRGYPGGDLLPILLRGVLQLSGRVKLLLSSRAEPTISKMFKDASLGAQQAVMQLHDLDGAVVRSDIRTYLTRSFAHIVKEHSDLNLRNWPSPEDLDVLVNLADVLFVYAATVVRFVGTPKHSPRARLDLMLARREGNHASPYHSLDQLYMQILTASVKSEQQQDEDMLCETLRTVVGSIIAVRHPLPSSVHAILLDMDPTEVQLMVKSLSALLLSDDDELVRVFHPSFQDFVTSSRRCEESRFLVSLNLHELRLARRCLELLNRHLRYNMANLDDCDVANPDDSPVNEALYLTFCGDSDIEPELLLAMYYAAMGWTTHVAATLGADPNLLDVLSHFCHNHLFHWFEYLSHVDYSGLDIEQDLFRAIGWCERRAGDPRAAKIGHLLRDTMRTLQVYEEPILSHALHVYHSAYVTMPHCLLLDTLSQAHVPHLRHTLISPRAFHWGSSAHVLEGERTVTALTFSPDGAVLVAGLSDGRLRAWSTVHFEEIAHPGVHEGHVMSVAFSSDSSRLASGSIDHTVRVWDGRTLEHVGTCEHENGVFSVSFSPDNSLIVSASKGMMHIWNGITLQKVSQLVAHHAGVLSVAFLPNGTQIVSSSKDGTLRLWDSCTYEPRGEVSYSETLCRVFVSPDSTRLALFGNEVHGRGTVLRLLDALSLAEQAQIKMSEDLDFFPIPPVAFSPDSAVIALGMDSGIVQIMDSRTLSIISATNVHRHCVTSIAFSPDGSQMASGAIDGVVRIQNMVATEEQPAPFPGHGDMVHRAAVSSDCSRLVTGGADNTVRLWDVLACAEIAVLRGHEDRVSAVAFSIDGSRVISGSADGTIRVWDTLEFREIAVLEGHQNDVSSVAFAPYDALIASCSADRTVRLWSATTFQELARMKGHMDAVYCVAFSPSGRQLASVSGDRTVRVWDVVAFAQVAELVMDRKGLLAKSVEFSLDGKTIQTRGQKYEPGPEWVSDGEHEAVWTEVPVSDANNEHPLDAQGHPQDKGWVEYATESGTSRIWLPEERRGVVRSNPAGTRLVIVGNGGATTILSLHGDEPGSEGSSSRGNTSRGSTSRGSTPKGNTSRKSMEDTARP